MTQPAPGIPLEIHPAPVPCQFVCAIGTGPDGSHVVVMQFFTPQGQTILFWEPDTALKIAGQIQLQARQAKSGILAAPAGDLSAFLPPPPGHDNGGQRPKR